MEKKERRVSPGIEVTQRQLMAVIRKCVQDGNVHGFLAYRDNGFLERRARQLGVAAELLVVIYQSLARTTNEPLRRGIQRAFDAVEEQLGPPRELGAVIGAKGGQP